MRKLKLDLDALEIESFETDETAEARGTVEGRNPPPVQTEATCGQYTCGNEYTCAQWYTCANTCADSCNCGGTSLNNTLCPLCFVV